jgi:hypothetical protein
VTHSTTALEPSRDTARPALRGAALSLLHLPPSLGAAFAVVGAVGRVAPALVEPAGSPLFFAIVLACATAGGAALGHGLTVAGWRVGAPDAEARATMLVVLSLGLVAATLAAGAVLGRSLFVGAPRHDTVS